MFHDSMDIVKERILLTILSRKSFKPLFVQNSIEVLCTIISSKIIVERSIPNSKLIW